jgi:hypothetical protein
VLAFRGTSRRLASRCGSLLPSCYTSAKADCYNATLISTSSTAESCTCSSYEKECLFALLPFARLADPREYPVTLDPRQYLDARMMRRRRGLEEEEEDDDDEGGGEKGEVEKGEEEEKKGDILVSFLSCVSRTRNNTKKNIPLHFKPLDRDRRASDIIANAKKGRKKKKPRENKHPSLLHASQQT